MNLEDLKKQVPGVKQLAAEPVMAQLQAQVRAAQDGLTARQADAQQTKSQQLQNEIATIIESVNKQILARKGKEAIIFTYGGYSSNQSRGIGKAVLDHVFDLFGQDSDIYVITEGRKHDYDSTYQQLSRNSNMFDCGQIAIQNRNRSPKVFNGSGGSIDPSMINNLYR